MTNVKFKDTADKEEAERIAKVIADIDQILQGLAMLAHDHPKVVHEPWFKKAYRRCKALRQEITKS